MVGPGAVMLSNFRGENGSLLHTYSIWSLYQGPARFSVFSPTQIRHLPSPQARQTSFYKSRTSASSHIACQLLGPFQCFLSGQPANKPTSNKLEFISMNYSTFGKPWPHQLFIYINKIIS